VSHTTVVKPAVAPESLQVATKQDLIARYNQQAEAITSLNAAVTIKLTAGSAYTGVIKQYHEVNGFVLAQKPASIRVIGQAPVVGTNIFDMVSDGQTFHIFIPSQHKFLVGPARLERPSAKPIENLRPQHLTSAMFWEPIPPQDLVLMEEAREAGYQYYVLTVARPAEKSDTAAADAASAGDWEIAQRIWFDRGDLSVARSETFDADGKVGSDVAYGGWDAFGAVKYPRRISIDRPGNDYKLQIGIARVAFNEPISADRFVLQQPPETELVNVGQESQGTQP